MYMDPGFRLMLDEADPSAKDWWQMTPAEARAAMSAGIADSRPPIDVALVRNIDIPSANGTIAARLYRSDADADRPLLVFIHGGGWIVGTLDDYDPLLRRLASDAAVAILSVDYRLAPEHPFPAAVDDAYEALVWATEHQAELGAAGFVAVGGDSSGGNIAGAVAQWARDNGGPRIDHQVLLYPVVTRTFDTRSYRDFGDGYFLTRRTMEYFWDSYVGSNGTGRARYADLRAAADLSGLPPATIIGCSLDPLCDEGEQYAEALAASGVPTTYIKIHGLLHGAWLKDARSQRAYELGLDLAAALRRAYDAHA